MKKKILVFILNCSGLVKLLLFLRKIFVRRKAIILCCHRVLNNDHDNSELMHGVVDATIKNVQS